MALFLRCGYVRRFVPEARSRVGSSRYKKGFEVRFVLRSLEELEKARRMLEAMGLRPGAPYLKHSRLVQPVYGRTAFEWFLQRVPAGRARSSAGFTPEGARAIRRTQRSARALAERPG